MLQPEYRPISILKKLPNNPRVIKDSQFKTLCESIDRNKDYFEARPIILSNRTGELIIIAGNQRYEAAKYLKIKDVPTVLMPGLTEDKEREIIIRDNISNGSWNMELLANEWPEESLLEWGLEIPDLFNKQEAWEDDYVIPDEISTDIVLGDLFEIGQHRLLCGDSCDSEQVARLMSGQKADMVFTDPPYGVDYQGGVIHGSKINVNHKREKLQNDTLDVYDKFIALLPLVIDNGAFYCFYATRNSYEIFKALKENNIQVMAVLAWIKINTGYADINSHYKNRYEPCVYCKVGERTNFVGTTNENTTWEIEKDRDNKMHPTQKPVSVPYRAIKNHTARIVADLFIGSGSTMVAAHQLNRKCYGMEIDPKYCQVILDRIQKLDPAIEIKRNGIIYEQTTSVKNAGW